MNLSFEPDSRMVPNAKKGSMLCSVRYRLIENKKFGLRIGAHPAFTLIQRQDNEDGSTKEITGMLRFISFEAVPSYQFNDKFGIRLMCLETHGLQKNEPQETNVLFFNTSITNIGLGKILNSNLFPSVYFHTDGYSGSYFSANATLSRKKSPFGLQSTINQTFKSNVPDNKDFMLNVTLNYRFSNVHKRIN